MIRRNGDEEDEEKGEEFKEEESQFPDELSELQEESEEMEISSFSEEEDHYKDDVEEESAIEEEATSEVESIKSGFTTAEPEKIPLEKLPVNLAVEVGRLEMPLQKVMELQAGNVLTLDRTPEGSVDLVVEGKRVGRGELIRVGNVLGIRILELG